MADKHETDSVESDPKAAATPDGADVSADPPGELLAEDLSDPGTYEIDPSEDEAEELEPPTSPDEVSDQISDLDFEIDDTEQLDEAEAVAVKAKSSRPVRTARPGTGATTAAAQTEAASPGSKRPTRRQPVTSGKPAKKSDAKSRKRVVQKRTTPSQFVRESTRELKKVVWPTMSQLRQFFVVVLIFVLFIIAFVGLLDLGFGAGMLWLFGRQS